jgi:hypothetical protein
VYIFPIALHALSLPVMTDDGDRLKGTFDVGVLESEVAEFDSLIKTSIGTGAKIRIMRGLNTVLPADSGVDIARSFEPALKALGDPGALGEILKYNLSLKKRFAMFKNLTKAEFSRLFKEPGYKHIGQLTYEFAAVLEGKPQLGRTAVGIFSGATPVGYDSVMFSLESNFADRGIDQDRLTGCWEHPVPGRICVRPQ